MGKYLGITVGPIINTMLLTETPSGLWGASYIFSYFVRKLSEELLNQFSEDQFISPVMDNNQTLNDIKLEGKKEGIGLYHDRIIVRIDIDKENDKILNEVKERIEKVKEELSRNISKAIGLTTNLGVEKYIRDYIYCKAVISEVNNGENPILVLGKKLDGLELTYSYVKDENKNYLLSLLEGRDKHDNSCNSKTLKDSFLFQEEGNEKNRLIKTNYGIEAKDEDPLVSIEDIIGYNESNNNNQNSYYAVVYIDGDSLGNAFASMECDDEIKQFSIDCFKFAVDASKKVHEYGGQIIYAGGDDLLFIAPLVNTRGIEKNRVIFELINDINNIFNENFSVDITLSVGMSIRYHKYPLYSALSSAYEILLRAKNSKRKNGLAIDLMKHSGQSVGINIRELNAVVDDEGSAYGIFLELLKSALKGENLDFKILHSAQYKISLHKQLFINAFANHPMSVKNLFNNVFKDYEDVGKSASNEVSKFVSHIYDIMCKISNGNNVDCESYGIIPCSMSAKGATNGLTSQENVIYSLDGLIRIIAFYLQ